jgi:hypothetical protein
MNNIIDYDKMPPLNIYKNNKKIILNFNLNNYLIYGLVSGGFVNTSILEKVLESSKIKSNDKKNIKKYLELELKGKQRSFFHPNTKNSIYKFILSDNNYKNNFSLLVNSNKLMYETQKDLNRDVKIVSNGNFINAKSLIYKNDNDKLKKYLILNQSFIGFPIILLIKTIELGNNITNKEIESEKKFTFSDDEIIMDKQIYNINIIDNTDYPIKLFRFESNLKINFDKNILEFDYMCIWEKEYFIDFMKFAKIYFKKINSDTSNIGFLINNNLSDESNQKLCIFLIKLINKIDDVDYFKKILNNINNYINKNYDYDSIIVNLFKSIPKKINNNKLDNNDFLLINYNEDKKLFNNNDIDNIILKILVEQPSFIIISTQDCNPTGKEHYQHILGEKLKTNDYNILLKNTKDILRMRIYYNTNKVKFNEKEKSRFLSFLSSSQKGGDQGILKKTIIKKINNNISNKLILEENLSKSSDNSKNLNEDIFLVKKYGIKESKDKKYGHGLVFMRLEISKNDSFTKFIFINCDLSSKKESEFENIINDFKLLDYWKKGYNIFFCGSFNFIFNPVLYENTEISKEKSPFLAKPINFIKEYTTNNSINKKKSSEKFIKSDTLTIFLENKIKNAKNSLKEVETSFYFNLLNSIEKLGIHPTYKYIKDESNKQFDFYNNISNYTNKLKDIDKPNSYIIKFLNTPNLLESIKNNKNLVYEYFNIYIQLKFLEKISFRKAEYKSLNSKIHYNKTVQQNIIKTIINMKNKNFINKSIFNELCKKYDLENEKKEIQIMINFSEELNKQKKSSELQKKMNDYINNFIKNKPSFNKVKNNIEKYIEGKDIFYKLNKNCEKFMKNIIEKGLLSENENNIIRKKRDDLLEKYNEIFNTEGNKIIPYQSSRILYALSNHIITDSFDFEVYLFPDKSSHKLTTLSFKIYNKDNIIINENNRSSITAIKGNNNKNLFKIQFQNINQNNYKQNNFEEEKKIIPTKYGSNNHIYNSIIPGTVSQLVQKIEGKKSNK